MEIITISKNNKRLYEEETRNCFLSLLRGDLLFRPHFIINGINVPDNQLYCVFLQTLYFRPCLVLLLKNISTCTVDFFV